MRLLTRFLGPLAAVLLLLLPAVAAPPTSTLTLPSSTTAYTAGQMIATNSNGTLFTVPSFKITNQLSNGALISAVRLFINDATSTAWGAQTIQVDLWTAAPTFAAGSGDRATFLVATGSNAHLRAFTCVMSSVQSDGVYGECAPAVSNFAAPSLQSGATVYWTLKAVTGSGTTGASKVVTLTPELVN